MPVVFVQDRLQIFQACPAVQFFCLSDTCSEAADRIVRSGDNHHRKLFGDPVRVFLHTALFHRIKQGPIPVQCKGICTCGLPVVPGSNLRIPCQPAVFRMFSCRIKPPVAAKRDSGQKRTAMVPSVNLCKKVGQQDSGSCHKRVGKTGTHDDHTVQAFCTGRNVSAHQKRAHTVSQHKIGNPFICPLNIQAQLMDILDQDLGTVPRCDISPVLPGENRLSMSYEVVPDNKEIMCCQIFRKGCITFDKFRHPVDDLQNRPAPARFRDPSHRMDGRTPVLRHICKFNFHDFLWNRSMSLS